MEPTSRIPDRCERCGRFVGFYPVGFCDDRYCSKCYDDIRESGPPSWFAPNEDGFARQMAWQAGERA